MSEEIQNCARKLCALFLIQISHTANNNNILKEQNCLSRTNVNCPLLDKTGTLKYLIDLISRLQHTRKHNTTLSSWKFFEDGH